MLSIVDIVLVVILTLCLGLYLWWKIEKTIYYRALRWRPERTRLSTASAVTASTRKARLPAFGLGLRKRGIDFST